MRTKGNASHHDSHSSFLFTCVAFRFIPKSFITEKKKHVCTWWLPNILTVWLHLSEWNHATSLHFLKRSGGASYSTCVWGIFSESEGEPVVPFACKPPIPHTRGPAEVWKPFPRLHGSLRPWKTTPKSRWHSTGRTSLSLILCWK